LLKRDSGFSDMSTTIESKSTTQVNHSEPVGVSQQIVAYVELLLIGVWLGSMMFFSFAVAPSAFAVLPTRELAGTIVTSTIGKVEVIGMVFGALLILIQLATWTRESSARLIRLVLVMLMIASAALSRFWISPTMTSLRAAMGGNIDDVAASNPLRMQFNDLHQYSVGLMSVAIVSGLVLFFLTVRSWQTR